MDYAIQTIIHFLSLLSLKLGGMGVCLLSVIFTYIKKRYV